MNGLRKNLHFDQPYVILGQNVITWHDGSLLSYVQGEENVKGNRECGKGCINWCHSDNRIF